jgi:hypothetical protein
MGPLKDAYLRCDMFRQISILRDLPTCIYSNPEDGDQPKHVESKINKFLTKSVLHWSFYSFFLTRNLFSKSLLKDFFLNNQSDALIIPILLL